MNSPTILKWWLFEDNNAQQIWVQFEPDLTQSVTDDLKISTQFGKSCMCKSHE